MSDLELEPYVRPSIPIVNPATGEIVELDAPTDVLAGALEEIRDLEGRLRDLKSAIGREVMGRMDEARQWTLELPDGRKVSAPSPEPSVEFDGEALWNGLHSLARDCKLSDELIASVVTEERVYKVSRQGANRLLKGGGQPAKMVERCKVEVPKRRYVSVK